MSNVTFQRLKCLEKTGKCPPLSYPKSKFDMSFSGNTNNPGSLLSAKMRYAALIRNSKSRLVNVKVSGHAAFPPRNKF